MTSWSNFVSGKICGSGQNLTMVPVRSVLPIGLTEALGTPRSYSMVVDLAAEVDPHLELLAQEVHSGDADPVQPRRTPCSRPAELAARIQSA